MDHVAETRRWVEDVVVGLNLCPFARPVVDTGRITYRVTDQGDFESTYTAFESLVKELIAANPEEMATALLIVPEGLVEFDQYLDALAVFDQLIDASGLRGIIQLASFHPKYRFDGEPDDSISHYTNRSPWPMFHLIRESDIEAVMADGADPDAIPRRNIKKLEQLGIDEVQRLWRITLK